jgi:hypothetical protein
VKQLEQYYGPDWFSVNSRRTNSDQHQLMDLVFTWAPMICSPWPLIPLDWSWIPGSRDSESRDQPDRGE